MKTRTLLCGLLLSALSGVSSAADVQLKDVIPLLRSGTPPAGEIKPPVTNKVDDVLERIGRNLQNTPESDATLEQNITRQMNLLQSTDKAIRPVGYVSVGSNKYILISRDGKTVTRLREGSAIGSIKVVRIEEDGVIYMVGDKELYSPISFASNDAPKPPQNQQNNATTPAPQMTGAGGSMPGTTGR